MVGLVCDVWEDGHGTGQSCKWQVIKKIEAFCSGGMENNLNFMCSVYDIVIVRDQLTQVHESFLQVFPCEYLMIEVMIVMPLGSPTTQGSFEKLIKTMTDSCCA